MLFGKRWYVFGEKVVRIAQENGGFSSKKGRTFKTNAKSLLSRGYLFTCSNASIVFKNPPTFVFTSYFIQKAFSSVLSHFLFFLDTKPHSKGDRLSFFSCDLTFCQIGKTSHITAFLPPRCSEKEETKGRKKREAHQRCTSLLFDRGMEKGAACATFFLVS